MFWPRSILPALVVGLIAFRAGPGAPLASAEVIGGELTIDPASSSEVTQTVEGFGSDSTTVSYSGTLGGVMEIDPQTGMISAIRLDPSRVFVSDFSLSVPLGGGFFLSTMSGGVSSRITSNGQFLPVDAGGHIDPGGLSQTIDQGVVTTTSNVPGSTTVIVDYSATPLEIPPAEGATVRLTSVLLDEDAFARRWRILLEQTTDITLTQEVGPLTIRTTEQGALEGTGVVQTRTAYGRWLTDAGLPDLPFTARNPANGIPNGILFALRMAPDSAATVPLAPDPAVRGAWLLTLPEGGTAAEITVEASSVLAPGTWDRLSGDEISPGDAVIPIGSTGDWQITPSPGIAGRRFLRLSATAP